jgi:hypothetical protein
MVVNEADVGDGRRFENYCNARHCTAWKEMRMLGRRRGDFGVTRKLRCGAESCSTTDS